MGPLVLIAPGRYVQAPGAIDQLGDVLAPLGSSAAIVASPRRWSVLGARVLAALERHGVTGYAVPFGGECSRREIDRIVADVKARPVDVVVGVGGGKTLDTAKAVAWRAGLAAVVAPTTASTDAPTASASLLYHEDGVFDEVWLLPRRPDAVLVDTDVVIAAPVRYFAAGMGDALATWYEVRACVRAGANAVTGGRATEAAIALARRCREIVLSDGPAAYDDARARRVTPRVERVVEANTLLSGIGFESGGLAAAHAIHNGLTLLPGAHASLHGEKVAYATITQLMIEGTHDEAREVAAFCSAVGLPTRLEAIVQGHVNKADAQRVAEAAVAPTESMRNMPGPVTAADVVAALHAADRVEAAP